MLTYTETFFKACSELAKSISSSEDSLVKLLVKYETYEAAQDEIKRSVSALQGMQEEMSSIDRPLNNLDIATIFPLNLPLYSLVIFGIAPSYFADKVFIRPPDVMRSILDELWTELNMHELFPDILLKPVPRQIFIQLFAKDCDVIIFTGKYENALAINRECPDALLIYNGSGINPFILFEDANINLAVKKAVEMRCFNSGQDCAGPDAFFVPKILADSFVHGLKKELEKIKVGDTADPNVRVGVTRKEVYINELKAWVSKNQPQIIFGGKINEEHNLIHPTIVYEKLNPEKLYEFHEFFAPYFYVLVYENDNQLEKIIASPAFRARGMYASTFGANPAIEASLTSVQVIKNAIVNDVEQGNKEYGGYGTKSNFLLYGDKKLVHPVLISRDLNYVLKSQS